MTKTKQQLRAEAVERLNGMVLGTGTAIKKLAIALGVKWNPDNSPLSMSVLQNTLTDLLTDDCDTECYECARLAELVAENSQLRVRMDAQRDRFDETATCNNSGVFVTDSREQLEADVRRYFLSETAMPGEAVSDPMCKMRLSEFRHMLDRQAAITRHECSPEAIDNMLNTIGELEEQLESAHAKNRSLKEHIAKMQEGRHGWHVKYPELERKNAELQAKVDELTENYEASSRALEILTSDKAELQTRVNKLERENARLSSDEFYLRCSLVDINGEVIS